MLRARFVFLGVLLVALALACPVRAQENPPKLPTLELTATQYDASLSTVDLEWTPGFGWTRIVAIRLPKKPGESQISLGELSGSADYATDTEPGFGTHRYRVEAFQGDRVVAREEVTIQVVPAPISAVFCTQPDPKISTLVVEWRNGMKYEEIRLYRGKTLAQTLPGSQSQTVVTEVHRHDKISITGVILGEETTRAQCRSGLRDTPDLIFDLRTKATLSPPDPTTGKARVQVEVTAQEDSSNPGFPNEVQGMQLATDYDARNLVPVSIEPGAGLSSPDFFDGQILPDGVTVGVILDFHGNVTLDLSAETPVAVATYEVVPDENGDLLGPVETRFGFRNGLGTGPPIDNAIVVGSKSIRPRLTETTLLLREPAEPKFRRGDLNGDGGADLRDIGIMVAIIAQPEAMLPLEDCWDRVDVNDDGAIGLSDLLQLTGAVFESGPPIAQPTRECGLDPTADDLPCTRDSGCP